MQIHILAILGLVLLCAGWVIVQRWFSRHDPGAPGVEGKCGCCDHDCATDNDNKPHQKIHIL